MNGSVAIIVPVLARPDRVEPLLESIETSMAPDEPFRVVFVADSDDIGEIEAIRAVYPRASLMLSGGSYAHKINMGIKATADPYVFAAADDLEFHRGWFSAARALMGPDIGVVGTQDLGHPKVKAGKLSAHLLVARWYIDDCGTVDEKGKLFYDGYEHNCCDVEACETAKARGAWAFADNAIVEHLHPNWKPELERDPTYEKGRSSRKRDRALLENRRRLWMAPST